MSDKGIAAQEREDLADIFKIVASHGPGQNAGGSLWHYKDDICIAENDGYRGIVTGTGTVGDDLTKPGSPLEYEGAMNPQSLHALAEKLRAAPKTP